MSGKEFLSKMFQTFFVLVTLINIVMLVSGSIWQPDMRFGYKAFAFPLIYASAGLLPEIVMYSKHELSIKEMIVRKVIQLLLIELVVNGVIFGEAALDAEYIGLLKIVSISIVIVFVLANFISWIMDSASAKRLTRELAEFQEKNQEIIL